jgi:hypothetical protein
MPNKLDALYSEVSKTYDVGSIQDFQKYLSDPKKRQLFFKEVIAPEYEVGSIDEFEEAYGFKKKSTESLGQPKAKDAFSVSGETQKAGPSEPSARKRYNVSAAESDLQKRVTAKQAAIKPEALTPEEAMAMAPMMGEVAETSTVVEPRKDEGFFGGVGRILAGGATEEEAKAAVIPGPKYELEYKGEKVDTDITNKLVATTFKALGELAGTPSFAYDLTKAFMDPVQKATIMAALEPTMAKFKEGNLPAKMLKERAQEMESKMQKVEGDVTDRFTRGDYADGFRLLSNELASSTPQMLAVMMSGGGPAGMTLLGLNSAQTRVADLEGADITEKQKYTNALAYGGAEVMFELFGLGSIARVSKNIIKREGPEVGKKIVEKGILDMVDDLTMKYPMVFGSSAEGLSEVATTIAQNAADKYGGIDPERDVLSGTADAFIAGNAMGMGLGGVVKLAQTVLPQDKREQVAKNQEAIIRAKEIAADPNLTEEKRTAIEQLINKKVQENETLQRKAFEKLSVIPEESRPLYASLRQDAMDLEVEIDGEADPIIREALELELESRKKQIKKIEEDAIQKQTTSEVPVQPEARVGEEVVEGKPQPEPQGVAEEGQAKEEVVKQYVADLQETKQSDPEQYWSVDSVTEEAAKEGTVITDEDGGVVVSKEGDIKGLFKKATSKAKGVAQKLLQKAVEAGGIKLDNFDNYLTPVYEKAGFRVVSRVPFNEEYAPEGWNKEKHGTPDVVAMVYDPQNKLEIEERKFEDYDEAMAYRDQLVDQAKTEYPLQPSINEAVNKSAQSLNMVAPDLKIIVAENTDDAQMQIAEALSSVAPSQAGEVAGGFTTETRGQTVFVNGKPFAMVFNKETADSTTVGHEAWEILLNDAFADDQARMKEFVDSIDAQLRAQGFEDIADKLDAFASQRGYEAVKYSEYMAELGGMLVASGFGKGPLTAQQKTLLQKIGDIINKFAQLFTGKKQFLDQATPEDILGFMTTISEKVSKGESVKEFFRPKENTETIKNTEKVFSNRSQKIGDFDIQYFEDEAQFKDLVDRGLVVQNASIDDAAGQPVATHQPDNLLVGNVNYKGKQIMEGNGGIYYVLKFGNVWASGKQSSAKTLAGYINKSRKESTDGIGRMVLVRGSQDKMISSVQGVKAAMRILEELVFDNLISTADFRKALTIAGKAYDIDFSGSDSAKKIQKDIEDKFMNVSDSTFARRGDFFSKLVDEIGKLDSAKKNIKQIQKALGADKNIRFTKGGIRQQIGTVLTERLLIGLDSGNAYAIVEVDEDVEVKKDDQHPSYPFSIVTKSGKPPVLKVFNYRPKAVEAIRTMSGEQASNAKLGLAQMGMGMGRIASEGGPVIKSKSQKSVPTVVDEVLTDDGKGNYLFVHYSDEKRDTIKPMSGSKKNFTGRDEVAAISSVGGVAMYYTKQGQKEQGVGDIPHTVLVPKDKVYFYGTTERGKVSNDPKNFEPEARRRFQEYRNRGNEARPTEYAFDSNNAAAWVTKVAAENGYDMVVTNWGGPKSYRAQTVKELTPEAEYQGFKQLPDDVFEVGDEVFVYGKYGNIVAVDGNVLTIESENAFGSFDTSKFQVTNFTRDKILLVEKAKPSVTTRSQKVDVTVIPGYERMMGEVEGILEKSMNRGGSYNQASAAAIGYIQKSAVYERADDSQREQIIRDFKKLRGEKMKTAPSVARIMGEIKDTKEVTVKEKTALKDQIKLEAKAAKDAVAYVKDLRMQISTSLRSMTGRGVISAKQATAIISRYDKMNILNPVMRDRFIDYMSNVLQTAEYKDKVAQASKLRRAISKAAKSESNQAEVAKIAKAFNEISPSMVEDIDQYIEVADSLLKSVARKVGTPLMRDVANLESMINYIDEQIQKQREQIKNELLSQNQDLVDAGILSDKMTINEIKKVVDAIEGEKEQSEDKMKEARDAVKEMMATMSPIIKQIVKTGEDPFTGDPIDLTYDERKALASLANMDMDELSLTDAIKAVEYANNFIANGITSGVVGLVNTYDGSLSAAKLEKKGVKSIPIKKNKSKSIGRWWSKNIASLPMLNKIMWGSTSRALEVMDASGVTGVSNGKAKAIKMVDGIVKEYISKFSKAKDFLTAENIIERGMLAFMSRTVIGDEFQVQDEFNRRKTLIEQTIEALKDPNTNTEAEIKKGETIKNVYDKILKGSKNVADVKSKVSETNQKAVDWWVSQWASKYDRMDEVSRNVYNTILSRDANFIPDRFQTKEISSTSEEDFESGFFSNFEYVNTSKSGSLKENNRIKELPKDKNGTRTRIVNLDFDTNNVNAMTSSMVDVETASSVARMKGFVTSNNFSKLFSNNEDKNIYKKRLVGYVNRIKGGEYVDQGELAKVNRAINTAAAFGTAKALFSIAQPFKQFIPPLVNTLIQTGRVDIHTLFNGGMKFIDESGYPIANRGIGSQGELKSINRKLVEAEKALALRTIDGIAEWSNKALEITLKNPDVFGARAAWISFYKQGLKKQGLPTANIDWNTHKLNKEAADYAQMMVDSQQNISDTDMQGDFLASKDPLTAAVRRGVFPLMTFVLNQKTRIWSDSRILSNKVASVEDKIEASKSLAGALAEMAVFSGLSMFFSEVMYATALAIMGEEDDEEEKKVRTMRRSASTVQNFMKDFVLPPIPGVDAFVSGYVNDLMEATGMSQDIPKKWFDIEDENQKFEFYDREDASWMKILGTLGIAIDRAKEVSDYGRMAADGKFSKEIRGNEVEKQLLEEDADLAKLNALLITGNFAGVLPSDLATVAKNINKRIQKRAENVEESE